MSLERKLSEADHYIVVPHNSNLRWMMMFYALPKEMFARYPEYRQLPRNLRSIMQSKKYMDMILSNRFLEFIWSCYAWIVWHCLKVPGRKGEYRPIPGAWHHYSEDFPIWRLTYEIGMHFRELFEQCSSWPLQKLFDLKPDEEMPWLSLAQFCHTAKAMTRCVIETMDFQPLIDALWAHRAEEDYAGENRAYRDFMRSWNHSKESPPVSIDQMMEEGTSVDRQVLFDLPDPKSEFENRVVSGIRLEQFKEQLTEQDQRILQLRNDGHTLQQIAEQVGYKTPGAVKKRIGKIASAYSDFLSAEYSDFPDAHIR